MTNTYKKFSNGSYGAWIDCGYGKNAIAKPTPGDTVIITTKTGEHHTRIVKKIVKDYKSGCVVSLIEDKDIAAKAKANYQAKVDASNAAKPKSTLTMAQKAKLYDDVYNEGYSDGFNPYRNDYTMPLTIEARD